MHFFSSSGKFFSRSQQNNWSISEVCRVVRGGVDNKWSVDIDSGVLNAGEYDLKITSIETGKLVMGILEIKEKIQKS